MERWRVGIAVGVFHPVIAQDSRELIGRSVIEAAVWSNFVVLLSPVGDFEASVEEVTEPASPQALLSKLAVEALDMAVLHGAAGLDVAELDLPLQAPGQEVATG